MFRIERSTLIASPPDTIYAAIADFHRWAEWSPYEAQDPAMAKIFAGAPEGVGAIYEWQGRKAGAGRMEITQATRASEATPASQIIIDLAFSRPMKARNMAEFTLIPEGSGTRLTWAMYGPKTLVSRLVGCVVNIDKLVGRDFETGLANLKRMAEGTSAIRA